MSWRVVITDLDLPEETSERDVLAPIGASLRRERCVTEDDVIARCQDADALLVQWAPITRRAIESLPNLKAVVRYGIGIDMIDLVAAEERGIRIRNVPHYCIEEVATHAFSMLLAAARRLFPLARSVQEGHWSAVEHGRPIQRLSTQTLGIIGGGRIGSLLAQMAKPLGLTTIFYDPYTAVPPGEEARYVSLETLLARSDFVSIHCPLTPDTTGLFNRDRFSLMKPNAVLINTSRGQIVNVGDLMDALRTGIIGGAMLDVLEHEPPSQSEIPSDVPNLVVTPHAAWYSEDSLAALQELAAEAVVEEWRGATASHNGTSSVCT